MANVGSKMVMFCVIASLIFVVSARAGLSYAQQQSNFAATLSGKNMQPPVNTPATGTAKFTVNPNGTLSYEVDANNIDKVIGVPLKTKNGTDLAELLNVYANTGSSQGYNKQQASIPTGPINGKLTTGVLIGSQLFGPLFGKNITDLVGLFKNGGASVIIRTQAHQTGELLGQISPAAPSAPSAAAPAANKTAAPSAPSAAAATAGVTSSPRGCVSNILNSWSSNFTTAHQQLVNKIANCFGQ